MSKWQKVLKQLLESGNDEALLSRENLEKALGEHGCTRVEIDEAMLGFGGFPLDDDDLEMIAGGGTGSRPGLGDIANPTNY